MIEVTRLNGAQMLVNSDLIKIVESSPDTMLTLIHGEKIIVRESSAEVSEKILAYRSRLLAAIAERFSKQPEIVRIAALTSLSPEAGVPLGGSGASAPVNNLSFGTHGGPSVVRSRTASRIKLEPNGKSGN